MGKKLIGVDEKGYRIGESHPKARLTDAQVEQIRTLYEEGFVGYRALAKWYGVPRTTIAGICSYTRRLGVLAAFKEAKANSGGSDSG